jgi:hypothetical protein
MSMFGGKAGPMMRKIVTRAEKVPGATHTWKGADNITRANIDDRNARLLNTLPSKGSISMGELLDHPELYKIYPDVKNIPVERMSDKLVAYYGEGTKAAYTTRNGKPVILLNPKGTPKEWTSSLLHEITHDVQRQEGLLPGSNPVVAQGLADKMRTEFSLAMAEDPKRAQRILRDAKKKYGLDIGASKVRDPKTGKWRDPLAEQLYTKQQGEQDAFLTQEIFAHQMERQKPYMTQAEFASVPQPPKDYVFGTPIDTDRVFEDVFGYRAFDDAVDMTTSGTRGFRGRIKDSDIVGY